MDKLIKVSDYVIEFIESLGTEYVFLVSGGGCIHLVDSVGKAKKLKFVCNHHEQACALGAEGYARTSGKIGACIVTTGPGGTNAITGVLCSWLDSVPVLIISGQIRRETMGAGPKLRQLGDQEINIIDIVKPITKYAAVVSDVHDIAYHLQKAAYLATHGRSGPVWIDIPLDIQGSYIRKRDLKHFNPNELKTPYRTDKKSLKKIVARAIKKIRNAKRPVLLVGNGVRYAKRVKELFQLISLLKIPVLTGFAGFDLVSSENPYWAGRPGTIGQRGANFTLQNSDVLLVVGSRLNIRMIGYNVGTFARAAYKIMVDIDKEELNKKTLHIDLKVNFDAADFIDEMIRQLRKSRKTLHIEPWLHRVRDWQMRYPVVLPEYYEEKEYVNPYCFIDTLSALVRKNDVMVLSDATASICTYQALRFPDGMRILTNSGCAPMGYALPAAIGACYAHGKHDTICLEGDGSIQLNIHELQTVVHNKLPIKLFVYNNGGYVSIRLTQKGLFGGTYVATTPESGISWPDMRKLARAYGLPTIRIRSHKEMKKKIQSVLSHRGPVLCEIIVSPDQGFLPKSSAMKLPDGSLVSRPLEDMAPLLSREELKANMVIPLITEI